MNVLKVTILTNGPGELWGWVRPVAFELRRRGHSISLWLLPCQFSSGHERKAASLLGVDKLEGPASASRIWQDIIREKTDRVIQLGGDVMFGQRLAKAAKAPLTIYSYRASKEIKGAKILVAYPSQANNIPNVEVIGDIVKDAADMDITPSSIVKWDWPKLENSPRLLILPGSRPMIRKAAFEWVCEICGQLKNTIPNLRIRTLFSDFIPASDLVEWKEAGLEPVRFSAGIAMRNADYALTQPGTNNFELMHCGLPALVVTPEKFLKFVPISGALGILANLPLIGTKLRRIGAMKIINRWNGFISLPNRTFNKNIMSELYGSVTSSEVVERVCSEINDIEKLKSESEELLKMSGKSGAASRLCEIALSNNESLTDRE